MKKSEKKNYFVEGPISCQLIADSISNHSHKLTIGAHDIFLGQVRSDEKEGKKVVAIEYSAYEAMAQEELLRIRENIFEKYKITCMHIYHSKGIVKAGEICLFVFVSSGHRGEVFKALEDTVEQIKSKVPVWGKEILEDDSFVWKENTPS